MPHPHGEGGWVNRRTFAGFTWPSVVIMSVLMVFPLVTTVFLSFNRIFLRDLSTREWIGFENYTDVLSDPDFWAAFRLTLLFVAVVVPGELLDYIDSTLLLTGQLYNSISYKRRLNVLTSVGTEGSKAKSAIKDKATLLEEPGKDLF
ncbi:MAG: hypothetical protein AAF480_09360, partial [Actinomycetota bacterium]